MANATSIIPVDLVPNSSIVAPTAQVLDTGTAAVVLDTAAGEDLGRLIVEVTNTAAAGLTVTAAAGAAADNPPSLRAGLGDVLGASQAQNVRRIYGPFEGARFSRAGGKLRLTFTPASGTITGSFICYRLPRSV